MIITKKKEDADKLKILALHGMSKDAWKRFSDDGYKHYQVVQAGFKYNMMDLQAALGIHQLARVEKNWEIRRKIWGMYQEGLTGLPIKLPVEPRDDVRHAYHLYIILIDKEKAGITRDDFLMKMHKENIGLGVHYQSIASHPFYQETFGWKPLDYPNCNLTGEQTVSLPLSPSLTEQDVIDVINATKKVLS